MRATTINALSFALILGSGFGSASCAQVFDIGQTTLAAGAGGTGGSGGTGGDGQGGDGQGGGGQGGATAACAQEFGPICVDTAITLTPPYTDPEWACVGASTPGTPGDPHPDFVTFTIDKLLDLTNDTQIAGITVKSCPVKLDPQCSSAYDTQTSTGTSPVSIKLPYGTNGFQNFVLFESPNTVSVLLYFSQPVTKDTGIPKFKISPTAAFGGLFEGLTDLSGNSAQLMAGRGHLDLATITCNGEVDPNASAAGATFVLDEQNCEGSALDCQSVVYYITDDGGTSSDQGQTGVYGAGGILNLKPGKVTVGAVANALEPKGSVVYSSVKLLIRENALTSVFMLPNR
jgi:hypothetical protein